MFKDSPAKISPSVIKVTTKILGQPQANNRAMPKNN